jgi:integrase
MPRPPKPWWSDRDQCYYTQAGGRQSKLTHDDGSPVARGDHAGLAAALGRLLGEGPKARPVAGLDVAGVAQAWLDWSKGRGRRRKTLAGHGAILQRIVEHRHRGRTLGTLPASALGLAHWSSYQRALEARGLSPRTIQAHFASLKACWRWASRPVVGRTPARLVPADPFRDAELDLTHERRRVRGVLTRDDVRRLLEAADAGQGPEAYRLAARIQAESGCRTGEVLGLRWEWWRGRWWEIPADQHKTGTRTGRARVVAVTAATAERVERWRAESRTPWVCKPGERNRAPDRPPQPGHYLAWFRAVAAAAGVPDARPYWLRDYFSNEARRAGVAAAVAARVQGHSAGVAERHYQSMGGEEAVNVVERVAGEG